MKIISATERKEAFVQIVQEYNDNPTGTAMDLELKL